jgi:hypothetical protein
MPDVTVSFTDAQWTRIVAASRHIKAPNETGNVDASYLAAKWKEEISSAVKHYEESLLSTDDF